MQLQLVKWEAQRMRLSLFGRSGAGKTYSSLLLAYGLCGNWSKIALIDTEEGSASLCSHLGPFTTLQIGAPFHPTRFYEALELCEDSGMEVIILDSLSLEWIGEGGVAESLVTSQEAELIAAHRSFMRLITSCSAHFICTIRSRQRLVHRVEPRMKYWELLELPLQQEGIEYFFTTVLKLDQRQQFHVIKDRTGVFMERDPQRLEVDHGAFLARWCRQEDSTVPDELQEKIDACQSQEELQLLMVRDDVDMTQIEAFTRKRLELERVKKYNTRA